MSELQRLAAHALALSTTDPELGLLLSVEAVSLADISISQQALQSNLSLMQAPPLLLQDHTDSVYQAVWSPDGQRILTTSVDGTAKIWAADGTLLTTLRGHASYVFQAAWSPDGTRLLTASVDDTARQWFLRSADMLAVAKCQVVRGLTPAEITQYSLLTPLAFDFAKRQCPPLLSQP